MKKKILFISWDGAQTSYAEGLFMPIFSEIQNQSNFEFHYIQFSNARPEKIKLIRQAAKNLNICYTHKQTSVFKPATVSQITTLLGGYRKIDKYIRNNEIDYLFPRSYFPAFMVNKLKHINIPIIYDADGLPADERVDFHGLSKNSLRYKFCLHEEKRILECAKHVFTRSEKSINVHLDRNPLLNSNKFSVITNGRNINFFSYSEYYRKEKRKELDVNSDEKLFVYAGSLGRQYGWDEMVQIIQSIYATNKIKWLILTGDVQFVKKNLPKELEHITSYFRVPFQDVPKYLSASDVAFAIRQPSFSMQGVFPIKLGEYFLMGLPTIASKGIGDTDIFIKDAPNSFLFDHNDSKIVEKVISWYGEVKGNDCSDAISIFGKKNFSIQSSAQEYLKHLNKI